MNMEFEVSREFKEAAKKYKEKEKQKACDNMQRFVRFQYEMAEHGYSEDEVTEILCIIAKNFS